MQENLLIISDDGIAYLSQQGIIELAYQNKLHSLFEWQDTDAKNKFINQCKQLDCWPFAPSTPQALSREWFTPEDYTRIDLEDYVLSRCSTSAQKSRALVELELVKTLGAEKIFKHLIYLVDVWRSNNLVWGVGRGSSVSCFLLYLIGINKINPLDYDLDYREFFKV